MSDQRLELAFLDKIHPPEAISPEIIIEQQPGGLYWVDSVGMEPVAMHVRQLDFYGIELAYSANTGRHSVRAVLGRYERLSVGETRKTVLNPIACIGRTSLLDERDPTAVTRLLIEQNKLFWTDLLEWYELGKVKRVFKPTESYEEEIKRAQFMIGLYETLS